MSIAFFASSLESKVTNPNPLGTLGDHHLLVVWLSGKSDLDHLAGLAEEAGEVLLVDFLAEVVDVKNTAVVLVNLLRGGA